MWKQSLTSKTSESIQHLQNTFIFLFFVQFFNQFKCLQNTYKIEFFLEWENLASQNYVIRVREIAQELKHFPYQLHNHT